MLKAIAVRIACLVLAVPAAAQCPGDIAQDGIVNGLDLAAVLSAWGTNGQGAFVTDINGDGIVGGIDLTILLGAWGVCGPLPAWATLIELQPDPAVVWDADVRAAIIETGLAWRVKDTATQMEMLLIPPGTFNMGCSASNQLGCAIDGRENPVHQVTLTNAFYMGRYEVTQAQWQAVMGSNPSYFQSASSEVSAVQVPNRPVERVSWDTIQGFLSATGMRLPTEAEWEYACRAGTTTAFHGWAANPSGTNDDNQVGNIAWFNANSNSQTRPVGGKAGNGFGLHDMGGNVSEWVNDWYSSGYYASSPAQNPQGPSSGSSRVLRGDSWNSNALRCSYRNFSLPDHSHNQFGFRASRTPYSEPKLTTVAPASGVAGGGTSITLTGISLSGTTSVTIGGNACTNVAVVSDTTVSAVTPAGSVGAREVMLTTPAGSARLLDAFTYVSDPQVQVPAWATLIEALPDPAVVWDAYLRAAIIETGLAWRVKDTATQMEMLLIPPGTFNMGCSASNEYGCSSLENPIHQVTLSSPFYMGRYEVTQAQWQAVMGSNPSYFQSASSLVSAAQVPNRPVERVSWNMIQGFLSETSMRLPTEAEWEYAYRAGTSTAFHGYFWNPGGTNDGNQVGNIAWYSANSGQQTRPVGGKAANGFGLHDMSGNVWEWVNDWYSNSYYASSPSTNPPGPSSGAYRMVRGSSCSFFDEDYLRSSARFATSLFTLDSALGFRASRSPYPSLTTVAPASGVAGGGTSITLTGISLSGTTSVTIGGNACTNVAVVSDTTVSAVTPAGSVGAREVMLTTPAGSARLLDAFTYVSDSQVQVPAWATLIEALPNPAVVWDADVRAAIIETGLAWRVKDTATQMEMLLIPPGTFNMGCSASNGIACSSLENPVHQVTLTNAFYMGRYEVTQAQWQAVMGSNPSYFQSASSEVSAVQVPNRPVERVSWDTIQGFLSATGMRLPTEAEWEYACRAGTTTAFHGWPWNVSGSNDSSQVTDIAWWVSGHQFGTSTWYQTRPVGGKAANGFGLHDMSGNVWEWVNDWYGGYSGEAQTNPQGPSSGSSRVRRGGSWNSFSTAELRSSYRDVNSPGNSSLSIGFRASRTP